MTQVGQSVEKLYEEDYALWVEKTVQQLENREIEYLDWEHLVEEIEDLGRELKRKVDSYLRQLLVHLLLYQYWEQEHPNCGRGWRGEITNFRYELESLFESKTLYNYFLQKIESVYSKARKQAIEKTGLFPETFPEQCPFSAEQIMDSEFF